jgi:hypothetical protein
MDLLGAIKDTPLPTVFVVAGIVFWLLAIAGSVAGKITVRPEHQQTAGILGTVLLISGLVLSYLPAPQSRPHDATVPAPAPTVPAPAPTVPAPAPAVPAPAPTVPAPAPTVPTPDKPAQPGSDWVSKFDGNWLVRRVARASAGCVGRRVLNFQIHLESGKVSGRFEPKEISDLPGSRPPIIGSISANGEINFNHHLVDNTGKINDANAAYYTGTFRGNSASGTYSIGDCSGTFTVERTSASEMPQPGR